MSRKSLSILHDLLQKVRDTTYFVPLSVSSESANKPDTLLLREDWQKVLTMSTFELRD